MDWKTDWGLRLRMFVTMFLLFALFIFFAGAIAVFFGGGATTMIFMFGLFSIGQWFFSDRLTLWSMGAKEVSKEEYPQLHSAVERLSQQADLPKPKVAVADSGVPNAFATGRSRSNAAVCVTTGLMKTLDQEEMEGVLAHELAHVKNRDMMVMTFAGLLSTLAFMVVRWGWLLGGGRNRQGGGGGMLAAIVISLIVWVVSFILIRTLSRYREYAADRGAAVITGSPSALASALQKISGNVDRIPEDDLREQSGMNAFFIIPIKAGTIGKLFATHPSTEKRIERLRGLEREMETV